MSRSGVPRLGQVRWSRDGRELFCFSADSLVAARLAAGPTFQVADRRGLFRVAPYGPSFDVLPDGRFLMIRSGVARPGALQAVMLEQCDAGDAR